MSDMNRIFLMMLVIAGAAISSGCNPGIEDGGEKWTPASDSDVEASDGGEQEVE